MTMGNTQTTNPHLTLYKISYLPVAYCVHLSYHVHVYTLHLYYCSSSSSRPISMSGLVCVEGGGGYVRMN